MYFFEHAASNLCGTVFSLSKIETKGGIMSFKVGDSVIVATCSGEYRGKVRAIEPWGFVSNDNTIAYHVTGPDIITFTKQVEHDNGRKLYRGAMCGTCEISKDCIFNVEK